MVYFLIFLAYPSLSKLTFDAFACRELTVTAPAACALPPSLRLHHLAGVKNMGGSLS